MTIGFNAFLIAVSTILDYAEQEVMPVSAHHSKRCTYIAMCLAEMLKMSETERLDLCILSLMHDNGISQAFCDPTQVTHKMAHFEAFKEHTTIGEGNIRSFPFHTDVHNVILYHHEHVDGSGPHGIQGDDIPLMSQIICFADTLDTQFDLNDVSYTKLGQIREFANVNRGVRFSDSIVDAFFRLSYKATFWSALKEVHIVEALQDQMPSKAIELRMDEILNITTVMSRIIALKCNDMMLKSGTLMHKAAQMAYHYGFEEEHRIKFQIAANWHSIEKLLVETRERVDLVNSLEDHSSLLSRHIDNTCVALRQMVGFDEIQHWTSFHFERSDKMPTIGFKKPSECFEARLLAALDMYEVLLHEGRFHGTSSHDVAIATMMQHAQHGHLSVQVVRDIDAVLGAKKQTSA